MLTKPSWCPSLGPATPGLVTWWKGRRAWPQGRFIQSNNSFTSVRDSENVRTETGKMFVFMVICFVLFRLEVLKYRTFGCQSWYCNISSFPLHFSLLINTHRWHHKYSVISSPTFLICLPFSLIFGKILFYIFVLSYFSIIRITMLIILAVSILLSFEKKSVNSRHSLVISWFQ